MLQCTAVIIRGKFSSSINYTFSNKPFKVNYRQISEDKPTPLLAIKNLLF